MGIPCVLIAWHGYPHNFTGCLIVNSIIVVLTQISIFGMLLIAIERFVAIKDPFRYQRLCTGRAATLAIVLSWWIAIIIGFTPVFGWNLKSTNEECAFTEVIDMKYMVYFNFLGFVFLPLILMCIIYCYIFHVVKMQHRQIVSLQVPSSAANIVSRQILQRETKAVKWFAIIMLFFAFCWLPLHIMNTITLISGKTCFTCLVFAILLSHGNSAGNPVLYAYGNTKYRLALLKLLGEDSHEMHDAPAGIHPIPSITINHAEDQNTLHQETKQNHTDRAQPTTKPDSNTLRTNSPV